jgi:geranylgeranyl transferase type-1 subunit beta
LNIIQILDALQYSSYNENVSYIFETYNDITGGFAKWPNCSPDPLHTFMGICGLSLVNYPNLRQIHPALVISMNAYKHLKNLHSKWKLNMKITNLEIL